MVQQRSFPVAVPLSRVVLLFKLLQLRVFYLMKVVLPTPLLTPVVVFRLQNEIYQETNQSFYSRKGFWKVLLFHSFPALSIWWLVAITHCPHEKH